MEIKRLNVMAVQHVETNSGFNEVTLHVIDDMFGIHLITIDATMLRDAHYAANTAFEGSHMQEIMLYGNRNL